VPGSSSAARAAVLSVLDQDNGMMRMVRSPCHTTPCAVNLVIFVLQCVLPAVVLLLPLVVVPFISCIFPGMLDVFWHRVAMVSFAVIWHAVSQEIGVRAPGVTSAGLARYAPVS
jgi:hypothetical protein